MANCSLCSSLCISRTQIVLPTPCPKGGLLAIGEAPGADEDMAGEGFVGRAGKTLDMLLAEQGMPRGSFGKANIVRCRPADNRKPTRQEAANCITQLVDFIAAVKPKVLLLVGGTPTAYFMGKGSLFDHVTHSADSGSDAHLHPAIQSLLDRAELFVVPSPHTSPLAFNRNAPNGEKWAVIARRQVATAVKLLDHRL